MTRRIKRAGMWACVGAAVVMAGLLGLSVLREPWVSGTVWMAGVRVGRAEFAWSTCAIKRQSIAYNMSYPEGNVSILVAPKSSWRPSMETASVGVGSAAGPTTLYPLSVVYVPLWPWVVVLAGGAVGMWKWAGGVVKPGHCAACGYDLSGLQAGRCPECGIVAKLIRWLLARVRRWAVGPVPRG